ncbi:Grg1 protein [Leucosporidium creatinivorum]|uniref:Grg1 protein n=1 Tax=Leucosporidium creatinivorum TaxID=106004 RepID=A0A1Y2ENE3_9BASI|nr:Grg1 protein [Leucosporidium creatinivorum]
MASNTSNTNSESIADTLSNAANFVAHSAQEIVSGASKEANKEVAKDASAPVADRVSAAFRAAGDKVDEASAGAKADAYKEVEEAKH